MSMMSFVLNTAPWFLIPIYALTTGLFGLGYGIAKKETCEIVYSLFLVIANSVVLGFNIITIVLPKIIPS